MKRKSKNKQYRQGDVLLERIDRLPKYLREKDKVLAEGEVTGHQHAFESLDARVMISRSQRQYVRIERESPLLHPEHGPLLIPRGYYVVHRQREYHPRKKRMEVQD